MRTDKYGPCGQGNLDEERVSSTLQLTLSDQITRVLLEWGMLSWHPTLLAGGTCHCFLEAWLHVGCMRTFHLTFASFVVVCFVFSPTTSPPPTDLKPPDFDLASDHH